MSLKTAVVTLSRSVIQQTTPVARLYVYYILPPYIVYDPQFLLNPSAARPNINLLSCVCGGGSEGGFHKYPNKP